MENFPENDEAQVILNLSSGGRYYFYSSIEYSRALLVELHESAGKKIILGFQRKDGTIVTEQSELQAGEYYPIFDDYNPMENNEEKKKQMIKQLKMMKDYMIKIKKQNKKKQKILNKKIEITIEEEQEEEEKRSEVIEKLKND